MNPSNTLALNAPAHHFTKWSCRLATAALLVTLAACGSSVKLDDVPVDDRSTGAGQNAGGDPNAVAKVEANGSDIKQPDSLSRVVLFDYDGFEVLPQFANVISANAAYLKADTKRRVALEGHTDERGGREYNLALGQKRAEAVRRSLSLLGVSDAQMEPVSFGEEKPAANGFDESAFAKNRRVEITYR